MVRAHREDHKIVQHPAVGAIAVDCDVLTGGVAERKGLADTGRNAFRSNAAARIARSAAGPLARSVLRSPRRDDLAEAVADSWWARAAIV